jgi:hypothetical protein
MQFREIICYFLSIKTKTHIFTARGQIAELRNVKAGGTVYRVISVSERVNFKARDLTLP